MTETIIFALYEVAMTFLILGFVFGGAFVILALLLNWR